MPARSEQRWGYGSRNGIGEPSSRISCNSMTLPSGSRPYVARSDPEPSCDAGGVVAELSTRIGAIRQARHDGAISQRRKPVGDAIQVKIG